MHTGKLSVTAPVFEELQHLLHDSRRQLSPWVVKLDERKGGRAGWDLDVNGADGAKLRQAQEYNASAQAPEGPKTDAAERATDLVEQVLQLPLLDVCGEVAHVHNVWAPHGSP